MSSEGRDNVYAAWVVKWISGLDVSVKIKQFLLACIIYCIAHIKALNHNQIFRWKCSGFVTYKFFHVTCMFVLLICIDKACSLQLSTVSCEFGSVTSRFSVKLYVAVSKPIVTVQWLAVKLTVTSAMLSVTKQILTGTFYLPLKCPCWSIICRYSFVIITANQATHYISCLRLCCQYSILVNCEMTVGLTAVCIFFFKYSF